VNVENAFKWRHYEGVIILLCVRWYLRYGLSYRDLAEMMSERGLDIAHTTIYRWVQHFAPELNKRIRPHLKTSNDSWRVDETYIRVRGQWLYLYRAVDSRGQTIDFCLTQTRSSVAARRFFRRALKHGHVSQPRVITTDKNAAFPGAISDVKTEKRLNKACCHRTRKYLNNMIEQDHRFIKRRTRYGMGFSSYEAAWPTLQGYEVMNIIRKGQVRNIDKQDTLGQQRFIHQLFGLAA